jgi:colicin import membrane protein
MELGLVDEILEPANLALGSPKPTPAGPEPPKPEPPKPEPPKPEGAAPIPKVP